MCCPGCQAVSQAIVDAGLNNYYKYRTEPGSKQNALVPEELSSFSAYDLPEVQQDFVHKYGSLDETSLSIDGITCAACSWLIEHKIGQIPGVHSINVNSTTQRAFIQWSSEAVPLSQILNQISQIGYQAAPYQVDEQEIQSKKSSRVFLLRLGLAGFATMQVMMFALALYAGYFTDLELQYRDYFRWVSMMFAAPVVLYSAVPFYFSAIRALLSGRLNMDVSVSIAIIAAFSASCMATINGNGEVYFESVSMFTFFLLLGRYFEQNAKQKASVSSSNLHKLIPLTAHLVTKDVTEEIPAKKLKLDDVVIVKPGEVVPADGLIIEGKSSFNESMLTGEQMPVIKTVQATVYAGTINVEQPIRVRVSALGKDQLVSEIIRLQELAANTKPKISLIADRLARYFTGTILTIAALTYSFWLWKSADDAFWITLSVLVATCPCALALATPTAVTCATAIFTKIGVITRKAGVFEKLPMINHVVFDKTGTLTQGELKIRQVDSMANLSQNELLTLCAALERESQHPIAQVFKQYDESTLKVTNSNHVVGRGIEANINSKVYRIGNAQFCHYDNEPTQQQCIYLAESCDAQQSVDIKSSKAFKVIGRVIFEDAIRLDAKQTVSSLHKSGFKVSIASGDAQQAVKQIANSVGIKNVYAELTPAGKLKLINRLQKSGDQVVMFGDGINDAPVLAGADLSVAMGSGTAIAKNSADLILLGDHLLRFNHAVAVAKKTTQIIKQNLVWALGYNLFILPLAVSGYVVPYIAAIGMSASSLIVVSNSLRILRIRV
ncbi:copper-translocating P-type ATPase [Shewanella gelidii]|uniref:P-type Cu(2+) transporter n=2 Tax=Shewanella gelidii TaxID=1642821 RepID=A0A917JYD3_9GAMM|nr:copper-translocating P-type ATPase [Shewanella gelidii]